MENNNNVTILDVEESDIPRFFLDRDKKRLCENIIAMVRHNKELENPRLPVVLKAVGFEPVFEKALASYNIYWLVPGFKPKPDAEVKTTISINWLGAVVTEAMLPLYEEDLDGSKEDLGIMRKINDFKMNYEVEDVVVLLCGSDSTLIEKAWTLFRDDPELSLIRAFAPEKVIRKTSVVSGGLDIGVYAQRMFEYRDSDVYDIHLLRSVLKDIDTEITQNGKHVLQIISSDGLKAEQKLLMLYCVLKYRLPPPLIHTFKNDYVNNSLIYPLGKLSLYERIMWLRDLPQIVGYIGEHMHYTCTCLVDAKIYPGIHNMYAVRIDPTTGAFKASRMSEIGVADGPVKAFISKGLEPWLFKGTLLDYKMLFKGTGNPITSEPQTAGLVISGGDAMAHDYNMDNALIDLFTQIDEMSVQDTGEHLYLSIKNTVLSKYTKDCFILMYCPEASAVHCQMTSEYIGVVRKTLDEDKFPCFIDSGLELAIEQGEKAARQEEILRSAQTTTALTVTSPYQSFSGALASTVQTLRPAIDLEVALAMNLLSPFKSGLGYYDMSLRCMKNIVPIVTTPDSPLYDDPELLKHLSLTNIRKSNKKISKDTTINSFGTLAASGDENPGIPVTIEAFKGCKLL